MPRVGFESTNPMFERAKTVHSLDRAATVIGKTLLWPIEDILKIKTRLWYRITSIYPSQ
jgi:hypothetical protein